MKRFHPQSAAPLVALAAALALLVLAAPPAAAQCPAYLCYLDLVGGGAVCPKTSVYQNVDGSFPMQSVDFGTDSAACATSGKSKVVRVNLPDGCSGLTVIVEYGPEHDGHTIDIGDSVTDNGYGGDAGSLPAGQNAEVHVVQDQLLVFSAADNPVDVDTLATANLALEDSAIKFVIKDQFVSWSQPYTALETPDLERLFFLPSNPVAPDNRTVYVALNRVVADTSRLGCGVRHALMFTQ